MPRRKVYGIPPTKRIKLDNEIENDENETNDTSCKNSSIEAPKTESDNHAKETESNGSTSCPNGASVNGIKYLHKKFKKMAAILSDDLVLSGDLPTSTAAAKIPEVSNGDEDKLSVSMSPVPQPGCSPVALPSCSPNVIMTAAVATTSVAAALPSEEKPSTSSVTGRHVCTYCKLVCNKPSVLQKHLRAHTGERPFPCLPCGFAFKTRSNFYKHCRSRSHSLKLEEVSGAAGGSNGCNTGGGNVGSNGGGESDSKTFVLQDDEVDDEDDTQTDVANKDEDSASGEERIEQPRKLIYKPKFHKYIQNSGPVVPATVKNEQVVTPSHTLNKLGLQLTIPTTSTLPVSSRSTPSTPSSLSAGSSPNHEFLKRHISKLISENQAIVETTDPFWSRKFYQRSKENMSPSSPLPTSSSSSSSSSPSLEQVKKMKLSTPSQSMEPVIEEKLPPVESRLASALTHPRPVVRSVSMSDVSSNYQSSSNSSGGAVATSAEESQPLNLTMNKTAKFVRPTSLPLQPGTFVPKKLLPGAAAVLPLISPETPRPNKSYGQLYIGGNAYTYLGLKCSTRSTFCTLYKAQPTYVPISPEHNKVSMYSNWMVRSEVDPFLRNVACYDSRQRYSPYTVVHAKMKDAVTHSSYWFNRAKFNDANSGSEVDGDNSSKNKTQSGRSDMGIDKVISNEEEDGDEEETEDHSTNDPKCQLEREVAKSLLSLSKISHQKVSEQYANAGLVPLNARPNTYPYNYSAIMSSKPHTTSPLFISEQKERETVSKNTGLARELQSDLKSEQMKQKFDTPAQSGDRYYFGSSSEMKAMKLTSDLEESADKDSVTVTSVFPIDLSSKNAPAERKTLIVGDGANTVSGSTTASISEILTPVSEPVLLATICSSVDRLSAVTGGAGQVPASSVSNVADDVEGPSTLMFQAYLKERAVQDLKMKQQYQSPHIKTEQREFDVKFNAYNEAFQKGAAAAVAATVVANVAATCHPVPADKPDDAVMVRTTPSLKRKNYFAYENNDAAEKAFVMMRNNSKTKIDRVNDSDSKENFALASVDQADKSDCSTNSVIILVGGANAGANNASKKLKAEFISPCNGPLPKYASVSEDGRSKCVVCNKVFSKPSQLRLHVNIHYFEQPFRCEPCAVSFRTKGHLHKHLGSNSHLNKMTMNSSGNGQTSANNPRPFKCDDCGVGFRIRGYLAKHLRSKMHIMKLECVGKLPFGTYTEMERCGINMNEIDTTNCENSLESLHRISKGLNGSEYYGNNVDEETRKMITDNTAS